MRSLVLVLPFVALTFCCWGVYGPVLHIGQHDLGTHEQPSAFRPLICVGIAYFLIAVIVPLLVLRYKGEQGKWTLSGTIWSVSAGAAGAVGALGIILAFKFRGSPAYVMPLVFGFAPVVNTVVTMLMARTFRQASMVFYAGVVIVALGAAGVMAFKPKTVAQPSHTGSEQTEETENKAPSSNEAQAQPTFSHYILVFASVALTALCWGSYGPVLHKGQMKMGGSRLRPFLCVGFAYFAVAVVVPLAISGAFDEPGSWNIVGTVWSLAGGAAGALGALGIIYAFNFGGKPIFVMPLVFGCAPVVNTFTSMATQKGIESIPVPFYLSLAFVIVGAVMVLVFAPKSGGGPGSKPASDSDSQSSKRKRLRRKQGFSSKTESELSQPTESEPAADPDPDSPANRPS